MAGKLPTKGSIVSKLHEGQSGQCFRVSKDSEGRKTKRALTTAWQETPLSAMFAPSLGDVVRWLVLYIQPVSPEAKGMG